MFSPTMRRVFLAILLVSSMVLAGCFGDGETIVDSDVTAAPAWDDYILIDEQAHESPREFITVDLRTNESTNMTWAVFDESKGGNCCEHYIATTIQGSILNIGGEYPVWSVDRGHEWDTWIPGVTPDLQCRTFVPTNPGLLCRKSLRSGTEDQNHDW